MTPMTVKELIAELQTGNPERSVHIHVVSPAQSYIAFRSYPERHPSVRLSQTVNRRCEFYSVGLKSEARHSDRASCSSVLWRARLSRVGLPLPPPAEW